MTDQEPRDLDLWVQETFRGIHATLYARAYNPDAATVAEGAESGEAVGLVTAEQAGDTRMQYDQSVTTTDREAWGDLLTTAYGRQYVELVRLSGIGGAFIG